MIDPKEVAHCRLKALTADRERLGRPYPDRPGNQIDGAGEESVKAAYIVGAWGFGSG